VDPTTSGAAATPSDRAADALPAAAPRDVTSGPPGPANGAAALHENGASAGSESSGAQAENGTAGSRSDSRVGDGAPPPDGAATRGSAATPDGAATPGSAATHDGTPPPDGAAPPAGASTSGATPDAEAVDPATTPARYELVPRRSGLARFGAGRDGRAGELAYRVRRVATHPAVVASGAAVGTLAARAGLVALQRVVVRNAAAQVAAQAAGQLAGRSIGTVGTHPVGTLATRTLGQLSEQAPGQPLAQPVSTATHVLVRLVVIVRQS
jgi:hypothetical protein